MRFFCILLVLFSLPHAARAADEDFSDFGRDSNYPIAPFTLKERSGKTVRLEDLRGKVWVASFFFTACSRACGPMNANLAELHRALADRPDILLVSISVNPEQDTPETLSAYAKALGADPKRWLFLTGNEADIYKLTQQSFMQPVSKNATVQQFQLAGGTLGLLGSTLTPALSTAAMICPERPAIKPDLAVEHTSYLTVVDRDGRIRGIMYSGQNPEAVRRFEKHLRTIFKPRSIFPPLNASLNATCTFLLICGYLAIRARREKLHKILMLSALAVSSVFLGCYLYYHLVIMRGAHTEFPGQGAVRTAYFVILLTHTVLAAVVAPLALYTAFVGLRDHRMRHVQLARWTMPMWLYVSITGVVVYWMLYQLYPPV